MVKQIALLTLLAGATATILAQSPRPSPAAGPTFDVVSVRHNVGNERGSQTFTQRPGGGLTATNLPLTTLIARAFPTAGLFETAGMPEWASKERYDVNATASLSNPTLDDRAAMLRAVLVDRFKLVARFENRDQPVYDLVLARRDGRLGSGMTLVDVDCVKVAAERAEAARSSTAPRPPAMPDVSIPPPLCTMRTINALLRNMRGDKQGALGDLLEGQGTIDTLIANIAPWTGRSVVNKTGLAGVYQVAMNFDQLAVRRGLDSAPAAADAPPTIFVAVQEQLGLKLESSTASRPTLVIDRVERPTEN